MLLTNLSRGEANVNKLAKYLASEGRFTRPCGDAQIKLDGQKSRDAETRTGLHGIDSISTVAVAEESIGQLGRERRRFSSFSRGGRADRLASILDRDEGRMLADIQKERREGSE